MTIDTLPEQVALVIWILGWITTTAYATYRTVRDEGWFMGLSVGWVCLLIFIVAWPVQVAADITE